jgi:hypothetical protein
MKLAIMFVAALASFAGIQTAQADERYAVVNEDGELVRAYRFTSARQVGRGEYIVRMPFDGYNRCGYVASVGLPGAGTPPSGTASVADGPDKNRQVRVVTRSTAGNRADRPFHLIAICSNDTPPP